MTSYLTVLDHEFVAGDGSFLLQLRCDLVWDRAAFDRLAAAMLECCEKSDGLEMVDRRIAEGFWFIPKFVREWSTHDSFPKPYADDYYERAYERLDDLALRYFTTDSPDPNGDGFTPVE